MVLFSRQTVAAPWLDLEDKLWPQVAVSSEWRVINYWALWCGPCREEVPELNRLNARFGIQVLGVNFDHPESVLQAQAARRALGIEFPVLRESPHRDFAQMLPRGLPATDLIDPAGRHRLRLLGPQTQASLLQAIERLKESGDE